MGMTGVFVCLFVCLFVCCFIPLAHMEMVEGLNGYVQLPIPQKGRNGGKGRG